MSELGCFQLCLIVFGGFINYFLADGYTYSIGVIYSKFMSAFGEGGTSTSLLPGLLYSVPQFSAIILCPLLDTYGYSSGAAWGAILLSVSCTVSAFAPNLETLYFTLGCITSVGLQLTYTSAIMAVTSAFKDSKLFGLAVGVAMCGSGIGSFSFNPILAWLLETWPWQHVLIIEGAILLHAMISASCFHHIDAVHFRNKIVDSMVDENKYKELPQEYSTSPEYSEVQEVSFKQASVKRLQSASRFILCIPSLCRFRRDAKQMLPIQMTSELESTEAEAVVIVPSKRIKTNDSHVPGCSEFFSTLGSSLKQLVSPKLWKNSTFLVFVLANGLAGICIVIPWTFVYDHVLNSLNEKAELDQTNVSQVAWLPSMIGLGSLGGQLLLGLLTSQLGDFKCVNQCCVCKSDDQASETESQTSSVNMKCSICRKPSSRHLMLFMIILCWNSLASLFLALLDVRSLSGCLNPDRLFMSTPVGAMMAVACILVGISNGAIYVMYPPILIDTLGEKLWPAGLGIYLMFNGAMNLIGTTIGGHIYDSTGSYRNALIAAACFPLIGFVIFAIERIVQVFVRQRK